MANFENGFKLTNAGQLIELKAQTGKPLNFTKFSIGDGEFTGDVTTLTELVNKITDEKIMRLSVATQSTTKSVRIGFDLNTKDITTGFYLREIGIYGQDPDTQEEVLMYYGNAGDKADYIPSNSSGTTISSKLIDILLYISNTDTITATIDTSLVHPTLADFDDLKEDMNNFTSESTTTMNNFISQATTQLSDKADIEVVNDLQEKVTDLTNKTNLYIKSIQNITLTSNDFTETEEGYQARVSDTNIKSGNYVDFNVSKDSYEAATNAEMQGYTICDEGYFILTCKQQPTEDIIANYTIIGGD